MKVSNPLADLLYANDPIAPNPYNYKRHKYERGMSITVNNHKQDVSSILPSLRRQYKSLMYGLTGVNLSMDDIRLWTGKRVPNRQKVMDIVANKGVLMLVAVHNYNHIDNYSGRGSRFNVDYSHVHMYVYGTHHYLPTSELQLRNKVSHLVRLIGRHNSIKKKSTNNNTIDIRPVGTGQYEFNDIIKPTDLYDYINLPITNPTKDTWINYMVNSKNLEQPNYPLIYIYKEDK